MTAIVAQAWASLYGFTSINFAHLIIVGLTFCVN
uniref:Uncharacterized protein n=1 Tax=Arundo donax TaxID=35708 RepID=A0A0A8Y0I5_ARUDO